MFKLGTVPYLNAQPLHRTLQSRTDIEIVGAVPVLLAPQLAAGECDVALIPVVEYFRGVGEEIISNAAICSSEEVRSVLVFHRTPVEEIRTMAIDQSSRTSVAMQHVILADAYGIMPERGVLSPDFNAMMQNHDAALLIGDPALEARPLAQEQGIEILDLGAAWTKLTGLPFVYAAWVARRGLETEKKDELAALLNQARDEGIELIADIAADNPTHINISAADIESYLTFAIEHTMTDSHVAGLTEFRRRCILHGLT